MKTQLLLVTHEKIGQALLDTVKQTYGGLPIPTTTIDIKPDQDVRLISKRIQDCVEKIACEDQILVLTDLFGATPSNLCGKLACHAHMRIVSGLNLSMLIRVMNYPTLSVQALAEKAITGGLDGIRNVA